MNWIENCSFVGHNIFMKMWWECVNVFDNHFLAHFIWKFPPPKINSEGSVLVTVMSSVLVYLGLIWLRHCKTQPPPSTTFSSSSSPTTERCLLKRKTLRSNMNRPLPFYFITSRRQWESAIPTILGQISPFVDKLI